MIDWKEFEKQSLDYTINTLSIASPFSLEEKQVLLETKDLNTKDINYKRHNLRET